jgi:pyruvate formate lyase activating enzyme
VYVSNSFVTHEALDCLRGQVDVLCSDIKSMDDAFYKDICGKACVADVLDSLEYAAALGFHVETRTNIIPTRNDDLDNIARAAAWIRDHLGAESPWHLTRFFPAYKLSHLPATPVELLYQAERVARDAGLVNVYVYADQGCDCATENLPVSAFLDDAPESVNAVKKCVADCCGDEGVLLKKYEQGRAFRRL